METNWKNSQSKDSHETLIRIDYLQMFSGEVKVTNGTLCFWDPRSPLANKNSILEVVDGCGYPQPTRVSVIKIILVC